jgi:signal transduction histidine kinase/CheY-like chemotaxis protein
MPGQGAPPAQDPLRAENAALDEQIKLLVRAEERLGRSQIALDRQLRLVRALSDFALGCGASDGAEAIVQRAFELLTTVFEFSHAFAIGVEPTSGTLAWIEHLGARRRACRAGVPAGPLLTMEARAIVRLDGRSARWIRALPMAMREPSSEGSVDVREDDWLTLWPLHAVAGGAPTTYLGALFLAGDASFYRKPPDDERLPHLQLLSLHVERALQTTTLLADLQTKGAELADANARLSGSLERLERTQAQLLQSQKMEAIGRLAGGVAHDFNNLLGVILAHAELILEAGPGTEEQAEDLRAIVDASHRGSEIIRRLLRVGGQRHGTPERIDLNEFVMQAMKVLGRLIGERIEVILRLDQGIAHVKADRAHLDQILMNLVVNARDAMSGGGTLTIETRWASPEEVGAPSGPPSVTLSVRDTGVGMSEETIAKIFEPFFTTKVASKGSGLGLAIVYGLVAQGGGRVSVTSALGEGSSFAVALPAATSSHRGPTSVRPRAKCALVAEDEDDIRHVVARVLRQLGYEVTEARNGVEADRLVRSGACEPEVLVTDVVMPGMGGPELARQLREARPTMPVLFMSGYAADQLDFEHLEGDRSTFLPKPFTPQALRDRVEELVRGRK